MTISRRDMLRGIAALPVIGLSSHEVAQTYHVCPALCLPRNLLQVGFTHTQFHEFVRKSDCSMDEFLKRKGLIPANAVLEKCFECATQDVIVFRWQHKDFTPIYDFDCISTQGPSEEWLKVIFG